MAKLLELFKNSLNRAASLKEKMSRKQEIVPEGTSVVRRVGASENKEEKKQKPKGKTGRKMIIPLIIVVIIGILLARGVVKLDIPKILTAILIAVSILFAGWKIMEAWQNNKSLASSEQTSLASSNVGTNQKYYSPIGRMLIPIGIFLLILAIFTTGRLSDLFWLLFCADVAWAYWGHIIIETTQAPTVQLLGNNKGPIGPGLHILLKPFEKIKSIDGFPEEGRIHTRQFELVLFPNKEPIEFAHSTEKWITISAYVHVTDSDQASYAGTYVLSQVRKLLESAVRIACKGMEIEDAISKSSSDIADEVYKKIKIDAIRKFGFEVDSIVPVDIELSDNTSKKRGLVQDSTVKLKNQEYLKQIATKQLEIMKIEAQQKEQEGKGIRNRFKAMVKGSGLNIGDAMRYDIEMAKYTNPGGVDLNIIQADSSISAGAAALGATFFSQQGQEKLVKPKKKNKKDTQETTETGDMNEQE